MKYFFYLGINIIIFFLLCLYGPALKAQTYTETNDLTGNTTLFLKKSNGKVAQANFFNNHSVSNISVDGYKKCNDNSYKLNSVKSSKESYIVKLSCDFFPKSNALTSSEGTYYFDRWNFDTLFFSETVLPEGIYDIVLQSSSPVFANIILHNFIIDRNIDTILYFNNYATDTIFFEGRDENNQPLISLDNNDFIFILEFPQNLNQEWLAMSYNDYPLNYILASETDSQYNLKCGQVIINDEKVYLMSFPKLQGISADTILINDPDSYNIANYVLRPSPAASDMYINTMTGWLFKEEDGSPASIGLRDDTQTGFVYNGSDTIKMYLNNNINEEDRCSMGGGFTFWEDIDDYDHWMMVTPQHNYVYEGNSVALSNFYPPFPADYVSQNNDLRKLGFNAPFISVSGLNNLSGNYMILPDIEFKGQYGEQRKTDIYRSTYSLLHNDQIIINDTAFKFEPYFPSEGGIYTLNIENTNYVLDKMAGNISLRMDFNLDMPDANSPKFTSFKILTEDHKISELLTSGKYATMEFTISDFPLPSGGGDAKKATNKNLNNDSKLRIKEGINSVHSYYKSYNSIEWIELPLIEQHSLFDSLVYGNYFVSNLSQAIANVTDSVFFDIKIEAIDSSGNASAQIWHPAFLVKPDGVGINENKIHNGETTLQIYPNPVNDNSIISFNLTQNLNVKLSVYNINGQLTDVLLEKTMEKGNHQINWNATEKLTPGVYLLKLETGSTVETTKVIVR
ncbi:MAG: T9SS type A sorting domain-containing protein [Lentimicrobiaceae bacterium]|nr:T9SS type A sorting domain-containing protein [Lentimicrobiaceae bacterium]